MCQTARILGLAYEGRFCTNAYRAYPDSLPGSIGNARVIDLNRGGVGKFKLCTIDNLTMYSGNDIDPIKGARIYLETFITDDALATGGTGGIQSMVLGSFGTGKSTLLCWQAQMGCYVTKGGKDSFIWSVIKKERDKSSYKTRPTTIVWRCRDLDIWITMIPQNWRERVPGIQPKKIAVFVHKEDYDDITFFMYDKEKKPMAVPNMPEVQTYKSTDNLITLLREGYLNIVLEPQHYRLSERLCSLVMQAKSDFQPDDAKDVFDELGDMPRKRGRGRPSKPIDYSQHAVKSGTFWFDVTAAVMSLWGNKPILFIWDEADDFLSSASADVTWWLIVIFTELQRDFRRCNLSVILTSHGWNLLHDSCYKRATHRILMPGIKAGGKNTMIRKTSTINNLLKGQFISEIASREFGIGKFSAIPNSMLCKIDGLKNNFQALSKEQKASIRKTYAELWSGKNASKEIIDLDNLPQKVLEFPLTIDSVTAINKVPDVIEI